MHAKVVSHVCDLILRVHLLAANLLHGTLLTVVDIDGRRGLETSLDEATLENLHNTVGVCMAK